MRAISKPSAVWAIAFRRSRPCGLSGAVYNSTQAEAAAPRPTRPRSWCNWLRPSARHARSPSGWHWAHPPHLDDGGADQHPVSPRENASITAFFSGVAGGMQQRHLHGQRPLSSAWVAVTLRSSKAAWPHRHRALSGHAPPTPAPGSAAERRDGGEQPPLVRQAHRPRMARILRPLRAFPRSADTQGLPPLATWAAMRAISSSRRSSDTTRVTMGVRPGGSSSMVDTSRSA